MTSTFILAKILRGPGWNPGKGSIQDQASNKTHPSVYAQCTACVRSVRPHRGGSV